MKDNSSVLKKIPIILNAERVEIDNWLEKKLGHQLYLEAIKNSKKIFVYKVEYKSNGHMVVGYIIESRKKGVFPTLIWNRGGSADFGAIKIGQLFIDFMQFINAGFIVFATQYSGAGGSEGIDKMGGDDIYDVLNLYKIIKSYKKADHKRIGMYGMSRGGMMTYMSLARVKWIKGAVTIGAPTDQISAQKFRKDWKDHQIKMYGGSLLESKKRSALYWADKFYKKTPVLIMHGSADWRVNPIDSIHLAEKLQKNKVPYRLVVFEGAEHGIKEYKKESEILTIDWLKRFVKDCNSLPNLKSHGK